jgi:beta-mannanase
LEFVGGKVLFIASNFDHDLIAIFFDDLSGDRRSFDGKDAVSILGLDGYRDQEDGEQN